MIAVLLLAALCPSLADSQYLALPSDLPVRDGVLGLRTQTLTADSLIIDKVLLHSPAHRAGIRRGDRLIAVGPYRVRTTDELARSIASHAPGDTLTLRNWLYQLPNNIRNISLVGRCLGLFFNKRVGNPRL